jgi:hypothetical protein
MSEWQPIETAPKDGTRVIARQGFTVDTMFWSKRIWAGGGGWVSDICRSETYVYSPTHWMPLPDPPQDE